MAVALIERTARTGRLASLVGVRRLISGIIGGGVIAAESWEQCGAADLIVSTYRIEKEAIMIQLHHEGACTMETEMGGWPSSCPRVNREGKKALCRAATRNYLSLREPSAAISLIGGIRPCAGCQPSREVCVLSPAEAN
ncbi:predicted protein [Histoplasma capsulatum var. duboisii H88]|uniref:Predicted protein n=1 Tax=Ajellomyces capsulatus (strain H88) TaxID=544711 RepID=F0UE91_AJEC8|nr:predicted protein [Histoplasma capsulatum var. duboisii H88]